MNTYRHTHTHTHTPIYIYMYIYIYVCIYFSTCIYTTICRYTYTFTKPLHDFGGGGGKLKVESSGFRVSKPEYGTETVRSQKHNPQAPEPRNP